MKQNINKGIAYYLFQVLRYPVKWYINHLLNLNLIKNEAKDDKGPFFITGNHVTVYDPIIALVYLKPLVRWVAADANYDNKLKTIFMKLGNVIPIAKRNSDIRTIKRLIKEVKQGNAVGLYPEGGRTWHGETDSLIQSTSKLIKLLGIKVYCQKLEGAYVSSPRWGKYYRKGVLNVSIYEMLSEEDVKKMTDDQIYQVLKENLYHNDYDYQKEHMVPLEGRDNAEYIERIIYVCPNCHNIHTFSSLGDEFKCKACHAKGKVNEYGLIEGDFQYDNLVDWHHFQKQYLKEYLEENVIEPVELFDVKYKSKNADGIKEKHLVNFFIHPEKMIIDYEDNRKIINFKDVSEPSLTFKNTIIFYENRNRHEFVIEPFLHNNASIVYIYEIIKYLRGK
ncbi:1-acyl-sn-glycerol-3-phosphate acyltransferase [Mycoplasmatota bacterium]|nr:1-acyl-sn-glycerol-3-phosphate acyltransferase [Mycoplasmatota bacterium]